jgi:hypothetical protein
MIRKHYEVQIIQQAVCLAAPKRSARIRALLLALGADGNPRKEQQR